MKSCIELQGPGSSQSSRFSLLTYATLPCQVRMADSHSEFILSSFLCCMYSPVVFLFLMQGVYVYLSIAQTRLGYYHSSFVNWSRLSCAVMTAHILDQPQQSLTYHSSLQCGRSWSQAGVDRNGFSWSSVNPVERREENLTRSERQSSTYSSSSYPQKTAPTPYSPSSHPHPKTVSPGLPMVTRLSAEFTSSPIY